jgi:hypothetical protein
VLKLRGQEADSFDDNMEVALPVFAGFGVAPHIIKFIYKIFRHMKGAAADEMDFLAAVEKLPYISQKMKRVFLMQSPTSAHQKEVFSSLEKYLTDMTKMAENYENNILDKPSWEKAKKQAKLNYADLMKVNMKNVLGGVASNTPGNRWAYITVQVKNDGGVQILCFNLQTFGTNVLLRIDRPMSDSAMRVEKSGVSAIAATSRKTKCTCVAKQKSEDRSKAATGSPQRRQKIEDKSKRATGSSQRSQKIKDKSKSAAGSSQSGSTISSKSTASCKSSSLITLSQD